MIVLVSLSAVCFLYESMSVRACKFLCGVEGVYVSVSGCV